MSAVIEQIAIDSPAETAGTVAEINQRLARSQTIPEQVIAFVHRIASAVIEHRERWRSVDPALALLVHQSVIAAEEAIERPGEPESRDQLRVAFARLTDALEAIAEAEPISEERSDKEVAQRLVRSLDVPQRAIAELLGIEVRKLQRWVSPHESSEPSGDDAYRLRVVARLTNQLRHALTSAGAIEWFSWPRSDLDGRSPRELLDERSALPRLFQAASSMRSTTLT